VVQHKHPPVIIFDLDGVLLDSKGHLHAAFEAMKYPWIKWNETVLNQISPLEIIRLFETAAKAKTVQSIRTMTKAFAELIPNHVRRMVFFYQFKRRMEKYEWKYSDFFPGTEEMIRALSARGIVFGAASNSFGYRVQRWLDYKHLGDIIKVYISRNDRKSFGVKPNPRVLLGVLSRMKRLYNWGKVDLNRVAFVGDNLTDILAAQYSKVKSIAVLSGHAYLDEIRELQPDYIIKDVTKIPDILSELFPDFEG